MGEYGREQRRQGSRALTNSRVGSSQLKKFEDNRNSLLADKGRMDSMGTESDTTVQFYTPIKVDYNLGTEAKYAIAHRQKGYNYGSNIGYFKGGGIMYFGSAQRGHSEEQMLNALGANISPNDSLEKKQDEAVGEFYDANMYTELQPCDGDYGPNFNCDLLLTLALRDYNKVYYSFDKGAKISEVQKQFK